MPQKLKGRGSLPPSLHFALQAEKRQVKDKAIPELDLASCAPSGTARDGRACPGKAYAHSCPCSSIGCPNPESWGHVVLSPASAPAAPSPHGETVQAL